MWWGKAFTEKARWQDGHEGRDCGHAQVGWVGEIRLWLERLHGKESSEGCGRFLLSKDSITGGVQKDLKKFLYFWAPELGDQNPSVDIWPK